MKRAGLLVVFLLWSCSPPPPPAGDPAKGEQLHASCLQCHGTEAYLPPARKVTSLSELQRETERWGDMYNPRLTEAEVQDLVAFLNRDFYKFP